MELKDIELKFGDKVTLTNGAIISVDAHAGDLASELYPKAVKIERPVKYETIYEVPKQILTEEEKDYLEHYLRPFKYKVEGIGKTCSGNQEFISVYLINECLITLPYFTIGKYYKRMRLDKEYTLKELGLFEE